jgi:methylglutamate dehydrogenase subunit B
MLLLTCPWCGPRAFIEFTYGGDATKRRPPDDAPDEAWYDYVYLRPNPLGPHAEHWHHSHGCRMWLTVVRDTLTHEIVATGRPDEPLAGADE